MRNVLMVALVAVACVGCTEPMDELDAYMNRVKQAPPPPIEPLPPMRNFKTHLYQPTRDPFLPGLAEESAGNLSEIQEDDPLKPDLERTRELLESFPLDSLDMVGTMGEGEGIEALVKDPDGVVHRVRLGNWLGQNYGQIMEIYEDSIALEERVQDPIGKWERRETAIALDDIK